MDHLQQPKTAEQKHFLEHELGLSAFQPIKPPNYCGPYNASYENTVFIFIKITFYLQQFSDSLMLVCYSLKMGVTRILFTASMVLVPVFYYMSINLKSNKKHA